MEGVNLKLLSMAGLTGGIHWHAQERRPSVVRISDVKFRNIRGVSATQVAVKLSCSAASPCRGVELRDIDLRYVRRGVATVSRCANVAGGVAGGTLVPPPCIWKSVFCFFFFFHFLVFFLYSVQSQRVGVDEILVLVNDRWRDWSLIMGTSCSPL